MITRRGFFKLASATAAVALMRSLSEPLPYFSFKVNSNGQVIEMIGCHRSWDGQSIHSDYGCNCLKSEDDSRYRELHSQYIEGAVRDRPCIVAVRYLDAYEIPDISFAGKLISTDAKRKQSTWPVLR